MLFASFSLTPAFRALCLVSLADPSNYISALPNQECATSTIKLASSSASPDPLLPEEFAPTRSNTAPPITKDLVRLAYQIFAFLEATGDAHIDELSYELGLTIQYICHKYHQPEPEPDPSKGKACQTKRSSSEPPAFPTNWATDYSQFRRAVKTFADRTTIYRSLVQLQSHFRKNELPGPTPASNQSENPSTASQDSAAAHSSAVNPATTRHTSASAEEAIYDRPIGPELPFTMDEATVQRMINTAVQAATAQFAATMAQNQQGQQNQQNVPPNAGAAPPPPAGAGPELSLRQPQFRARDIGYFDPAPGPAIEVKDNHNIYHNVFSFTNRLRVKATTMDPTVLQQNLDSCLLGAAENWYTNELAHLSRIGLRNDNDGVKEWCNALEARFRDSPSKSLVALEAIRYTVRDARSRRDPLDYVSTLVLHAKNAGIAPTEAAQVMLAYEHIDGQLRLHLPRPQDNSTIAGLLEELRHQKDIWFDIYGNDSRQMATRPGNDKGKQPQGNNPFRSNFNFNSERPYMVAGDSQALVGRQDRLTLVAEIPHQILTALSFLMATILSSILRAVVITSNRLPKSNKGSCRVAVSSFRLPAAEKTQTRPLGTTKLVNNFSKTATIVTRSGLSITISRINGVPLLVPTSMTPRRTRRTSIRTNKRSMMSTRMPTTRTPNGRDLRMSRRSPETKMLTMTNRILRTLLKATLLLLCLPASSSAIVARKLSSPIIRCTAIFVPRCTPRKIRKVQVWSWSQLPTILLPSPPIRLRRISRRHHKSFARQARISLWKAMPSGVSIT